MKPRALFFLAFALIFIGQNDAEYLRNMLGVLSQLLYVLVTIVAPLLLLYGFLRGTLDVFRKSAMLKLSPLLLAGLTVQDFLNNLSNLFMALILIILPFTFALLMWKVFIKVVKA